MSLFANGLAKVFEIFSPSKKNLAARAPRIQLLPLHNIHFRIQHPTPSGPIEISNISPTGMGFFRKSIQTWSEPGSYIEGLLLIDGKPLTLKLKIEHISNSIVGCSFAGGSAGTEIQTTVQSYFENEMHAIELSEVNPQALRPHEEGQPRWFYGTNNCDLYFVTNEEGKMVYFSLSFFASFIEGGENRPTKAGTIQDSDQDEKPKHKEVSLVSWSPEISSELIDAMIKFVENIPQLSAQEKTTLCRFVERGRAKEKFASA